MNCLNLIIKRTSHGFDYILSFLNRSLGNINIEFEIIVTHNNNLKYQNK